MRIYHRFLPPFDRFTDYYGNEFDRFFFDQKGDVKRLFDLFLGEKGSHDGSYFAGTPIPVKGVRIWHEKAY